MGWVKIPYYIVKNGRGFWNPTAPMKRAGFNCVACGIDSPAARSIAETWNARWQTYRKGMNASKWPAGSLGEAFEKFRKTETWARKEPRTRQEWDAMWRLYISPIFGDYPPNVATFDRLDKWYSIQLTTKGVREAHRAMKIWRALWRVAGAMKYCDRDNDPSLGIRRKTPTPRTQVWTEGEVVRLVKGAWRMGYHGLAALLAIAWDTQLAPIDCRRLTSDQIDTTEQGAMFFKLGRAKTGAAAIGTLSKRSQRLLKAYLSTLGAKLLPTAPILRNRSGAAYSKETLNKDFAKVRASVLGLSEKRWIMDMRRSGAVEAMAGKVDDGALAAKMANTIDQARELQRTYLPVDPVSVARADDARRRGRGRLRQGTNPGKKSELA
jgi:integrase